MKVSKLAENIIGSEIIKLAAEVNEKIKQGEKIYNFTIGDFNPNEFPIPEELKQFIIAEYIANQTNYPAADGMLELRTAVSSLLKQRGAIDYKPDEILIAGGARPVIYSIFKALVDPGDTVIFAVPSWNNNHYTYLNGAIPVIIEASPEQNFMPQAKDIKPYISKATLVALCSPQNPTGTVFTKEGLEQICDMILEENKKRDPSQKPVYLMYDQIYWALTFGDVKHYNPVSLRPEMKNYTVFVDGISKSLAATGVRVGWSMGPKFIIDKMRAILTHVGAWAPKAEQLATAKYLTDLNKYDSFIEVQKEKINARLTGFYNGFQSLKAAGYKVDAITPQAAIYLTVQFNLHGQKTADGNVLATTKDITKYLLDEAKLAIVPFSAFGASVDSSWYRLSVGTCKLEDVDGVIANLKTALSKLS
ncbi:MAG: aminotransferase class I/II-fold pyridoxal phosphate-dependent enzyme [Bacteroidota bacterium]|nr:aminotransferase class I/II-fold pyridoxal phosphate-dependent enzyme [Bacteroidota bacterium]MDP3145133.1 aminotransferase class I/II-fold pyridoxal phosphate-dependent enzyme [Bacteroidota bacterium]